jgi:hypothetical protein
MSKRNTLVFTSGNAGEAEGIAAASTNSLCLFCPREARRADVEEFYEQN